MIKELEKIKAYVRAQTEGMAEHAKIELLDALAWWAGGREGRSAEFRVAGRREL